MQNATARTRYSLLCLFLIIHLPALAQSRYQPADVFPALPLLPPGNEYRTATGEPGRAYWQNSADYLIDVSLDDKKDVITGSVTITYTNNSPKALSYLWLQLEQNVFKKGSRGIASKLFLYKDSSLPTPDGGYEIESITSADQGGANMTYQVYDTRMQLELAQPLETGHKLSFRIRYHYNFPVNYKNADFLVNRTDILPTKNGKIYSVCQWYPRMCVLDDVEGWNTLPYLGNGEFYLDYGDYRVNITAPASFIVEGSGDLLNPEEVLTPAQLKRWQSAKESRQPVQIRTAAEVTDPASRPAKPFLTWKYTLSHARDFAWTASRSFIWEAVSFPLAGGRRVVGSSLYPVESDKPGSWRRSSEFIRFTLQFFSEKWFSYPYNKMVNVASNLDGMEYPGMVFCSAKDTGDAYWTVVNHELGHTWFPMVVGSNERKYAWMDEGFNVFIDLMASKAFNRGEFNGYGGTDTMTSALFAGNLMPLLTRPDAIPGEQVFPLQYQKTAYLLTLLRTRILGADRFDRAFQTYIREWAYKHPTPWDFFRSINASAGEDLTWFWKPMFMENYRLDQRVAAVENRPGEKATITIENAERAVMPLAVDIVYASGATERQEFPVEIWMMDGRYTFESAKKEPLARVIIDPEHAYPDVDRSNNVYEVKR